MDIPINANVTCADGECGRSSHIILNPENEQVTHIVVRMDDDMQYMVPVDMVIESTPRSIQLRCKSNELQDLPKFIKNEFIPLETPIPGEETYMMWPYPEDGLMRLDIEQIPSNELAIRKGALVLATDGLVGRADEFLVNPLNDQITHLVLEEGHFWNRKEVTIPVNQIDHLEEDTIFLKINKATVAALPTSPVPSKT